MGREFLFFRQPKLSQFLAFLESLGETPNITLQSRRASSVKKKGMVVMETDNCYRVLQRSKKGDFLGDPNMNNRFAKIAVVQWAIIPPGQRFGCSNVPVRV